MTQLTKLSLANRLIVGMVTVAIVIFGVLAAVLAAPGAVAVDPGADRDRHRHLPGHRAGAGGRRGGQAAGAGDQRGLRGDQGAVGLDQRAGQPDRRVDLRAGQRRGRRRHPQRRRRAGRHSCPRRSSTRCWPAAPTTSRSWCSGVASDAPLDELARQVDDIVVPQLSGVEGVRQVQVAGQDTTELVVTLQPDQLRKYDLNAAAVTQAVQAQALVVPAGNSYDGTTRAGHPGRRRPRPRPSRSPAGRSRPRTDR